MLPPGTWGATAATPEPTAPDTVSRPLFRRVPKLVSGAVRPTLVDWDIRTGVAKSIRLFMVSLQWRRNDRRREARAGTPAPEEVIAVGPSGVAAGGRILWIS